MSALTSVVQDGVRIVYFRDVRIIDETHIQSIGADLLDLVDQTRENQLLLNFRNVKFMASAMIGKIILLSKKCRQSKVDLRLCELSENIMEVFKLMKLDTKLEILEDEDAALDSYQKHKKKWYI